MNQTGNDKAPAARSANWTDNESYGDPLWRSDRGDGRYYDLPEIGEMKRLCCYPR
ncbi:hypothetical protein J4727_05410 [Providencia rettgeri]|uniref:Uncharacterized protein n=1 Tax=Providencia rettgeri TaxID=587 RepID=A0A939NAE3_PRORE|nr:hypothetical protein [Providencia rettgeri]